MTNTPTDAGTPGDVGLPSEETIARRLAEAYRQSSIPDDIWAGMVGSFRKLEAKHPDYAEGYSVATDAFRLARAVLSLIRPAFEAKERETATEKERADMAVRQMIKQNDRIRELAALLDKQMGTPCEQIRHQQEIEKERAAKIEAMQYAQDIAWQNGKLHDRALSAEAMLAQAVEANERLRRRASAARDDASRLRWPDTT